MIVVRNKGDWGLVIEQDSHTKCRIVTNICSENCDISLLILFWKQSYSTALKNC